MFKRKRKRKWSVRTGFVVFTASAGVCLSASSALAQQTCYRAVDITPLGFIPNLENFRFGINSGGEIVGTYEEQVKNKKHAFVWLPEDNYNNLTRGFHDLHDLAGLGTNEESAAYEINAQGVAVGWITIEGDQHAVVWEINLHDEFGSPKVSIIDLTTYALPNDDAPNIVTVRVAWSIDDNVPPQVVGDAAALSNCACPPTEQTDATIGFSAILDGSNQIEELLPFMAPPICDFRSGARDIDEIIVGISSQNIGGLCAGDTSLCQESKDAVKLTEGASASILTDFSAGASEARGTNTAENLVGWGFENDDVPCQMSASFWEDVMASPFNLGSVAGITPGDETRAEAMSNPDLGGEMLIVGKNETLDHALLWEGSGATWTATDLTTVVINQCAGIDDLIPVEAHDVNDDGWIVGWADANPNGPIETHAILLVPADTCQVCCFADLDCSGNVSTADLLILFANWGPCVGCAADLDCDGNVGTEDLIQLLGAWDTCDLSPPLEIPSSIEDCINRYFPDHTEALIACIEAMGE